MHAFSKLGNVLLCLTKLYSSKQVVVVHPQSHSLSEASDLKGLYWFVWMQPLQRVEDQMDQIQVRPVSAVVRRPVLLLVNQFSIVVVKLRTDRVRVLMHP